MTQSLELSTLTAEENVALAKIAKTKSISVREAISLAITEFIVRHGVPERTPPKPKVYNNLGKPVKPPKGNRFP